MRTSVYSVAAAGQGYEHVEVELGTVSPGEVLVEIVASGICNSDVGAQMGKVPCHFPAVLGHEGTGIVKEVGAAVKRVKVGDSVVLSWAYCRTCSNCSQGHPATCKSWVGLNLMGTRSNGEFGWSEGGKSYGNLLGQGSFSKHLITDESCVIPVSKNADLVQLAAGIGCGVLTGAGTVHNALVPKPMSSLVVFGVGAVGAGAIAAALTSPCVKVIAVDIHAHRLETAKGLGATHTLQAGPDVVKQIIELTGGGADYAVEATGVAAVMKQAYECLALGGTVASVGIPPPGSELALAIGPLMSANRKVIGVPLGDTIPELYVTFLAELVAQGRLNVDSLVKKFPFGQINEAVAAMRDGSVIKPVLVW